MEWLHQNFASALEGGPPRLDLKDSLCPRCRGINLNRMLIGKGSREDWYQLGSGRFEWAIPGCNLCQWLVRMSPAENDKVLEGLHLRWTSFWQSGPWNPTGLLFVSTTYNAGPYRNSRSCGPSFCSITSPESSDGFRSDEAARGRLINPNTIDYSIFKDWIASCHDHHQNCHNIEFIPRKLINCTTRMVESSEVHRPYVALSYMWGNSSYDSFGEHATALPATIPVTIEDTMTVTKCLGYTYLWVDRYCIAQSSHYEKFDQIGKMDRIYSGADLVLIAAAGEDPDFGLPGVSSCLRSPQPHASVGEHTLVSLMTEPRTIIAGSRWASRAWTYQEAMFAKRRLFFTEEQVHFVCRSAARSESLNRPIVAKNSRELNSQGSFYNPEPVEDQPWTIFNHIAEYTSRELKYSSDSLNGMLGIFRHFEQTEKPLRHLCGVPILNSIHRSAQPRGTVQPQMGLSSLEGFLFGLCWTSSRPGTRRPEFPSWSWTGWSGQVKGRIQMGARLGSPAVTSLKGFASGRRWDWEVYVNEFAYKTQQQPHSPLLIIEGRTLEVQLHRATDSFGRERMEVRPAQIEKDAKPAGRASFANDTALKEGVYTGLVLHEIIIANGAVTALIIILEGHEGNIFERVGLLEVNVDPNGTENYEDSIWYATEHHEIRIK